jgi:hypothetical protein
MKTAQLFVYISIIILALLRIVFHLDIPFMYPLFFALITIAIILKVKLVKDRK